MPLGDELKFSVPSGAWMAVASVSVAVHCAEVPIWTVEGEQLSVVVVGSTAVAAPLACCRRGCRRRRRGVDRVVPAGARRERHLAGSARARPPTREHAARRAAQRAGRRRRCERDRPRRRAHGLAAVSVTVTVHVVGEPVGTDAGEQTTAVVVGSSAANAVAGRPAMAIPVASASNPKRRRRVMPVIGGSGPGRAGEARARAVPACRTRASPAGCRSATPRTD